MDKLENLSSSALNDRLAELRRVERHLIVEFLQHLAELDRRKLYLELGFGSCYAFCREQLRLSDGSAYRRIAAARLLARFPVVADHLRDGRLSMSTLVALRDVLDEEHLGDILSRAAGRTEDQVKELVATLRPVDTFGAKVLRSTVSREFAADLERVRAELSHKVPMGRVEDVLHECMRITLQARAKRPRGRGRRYVTAAVRDAVFARDGHRCAYLTASGRRCGSTWQLELHHIVPFALGGEATVDNLGVRCRAHNLHHAERDFEELSASS